MKKGLLVTLIIFILCGCEGRIFESNQSSKKELVTQLIELGYSKEAAEIIDKLNEETKEKFLEEYDYSLEQLIKIDNFKEEYINDYLNSDFDIDSFKYLVEEDLLESDKLTSFTNFYKDKFFMLNNIELYFKYKKDFTDTRSLIEYVNSKAYKKAFEECIDSDISKDTLMIASKIYYLGEYVPDDLVNVETDYYILSQPQLRKEAWLAYKEMADAARKENIYFYISTAYRSYDFQSTLYNNYLLNDPPEVVDTYSSRPGYSDHQTGLAADIRTEDKAFSDFTNTKAAEWLKTNAYKFGFIMRYPEGKEKITGYIPESWHYRYVGKDAANIIYENNITFDEYYSYFVK